MANNFHKRLIFLYSDSILSQVSTILTEIDILFLVVNEFLLKIHPPIIIMQKMDWQMMP